MFFFFFFCQPDSCTVVQSLPLSEIILLSHLVIFHKHCSSNSHADIFITFSSFASTYTHHITMGLEEFSTFFFEILSDLNQAVPDHCLFLFHSILRLTSFLSQNENRNHSTMGNVPKCPICVNQELQCGKSRDSCFIPVLRKTFFRRQKLLPDENLKNNCLIIHCHLDRFQLCEEHIMTRL